MSKFVLIISVMMFIGGCSNYKILKTDISKQSMINNQKNCYMLDKKLFNTKKIFSKNYLNKERQSSDSHYIVEPNTLISNVVNIAETCINPVLIKDINIFDIYSSDTAEWREVFYIEIVIDYKNDDFEVLDGEFRDYESTGWIKVFRFNKPESVIISETIQRGLFRIFTDIEETISKKLSLKQRNAKKSKERLETERLMDKYIDALKNIYAK